jgi:putative membrane protein
VIRARKSLWLAGAGAIVMFAVSLSMNGAVLADSKPTPPTVETTLGADGSAVSTRVLNRNGADTSGISGSSALKTSIAYSLNGQPANRDQFKGARGPVTVTYKVENPTGKTQDVTYTSADGQQHTQQLLIQVPFVAIVEATVPGSYNNVQAPGGAVSAGTDGNLHIIWSLVLFSPIGSPTQEVSFSAQADAPQGLPGVTVTARSINPSATEGLSSGTLTANAAVAQNDLFGSYATGADQGLTQLRTGIGQLVDGLTKLHDGSTQLAFGLSNPACDRANPTNPANPCGIQEGSQLLANAFKSPTGGPDLESGSAQLAAGLAQINAGLAQLADPATGLPAAAVGIAQLQAGINQIIVGLSNPACNPASPLNPANPCGITQGLAAIKGGVTTQLLPGVAAEIGGDLCVKSVVLDVANGSPAAPCLGLPALGAGITVAQGKVALLTVAAIIGSTTDSVAAPLIGGHPTLIGGLNGISGGLSNPACVATNPLNSANPCGVVQGLDALTNGVGLILGGLTTQVSPGLAQLAAGTAAAVNGVNQLHAGSTSALAGANQLSAGINTAGAGAITLAAGVPQATSGAQQIRDGLAQALSGAQQAGPGTSAISSQGTAPLIAKLQDASNNAHLELATIDATGARAGSAPLGADATWLYRLDAVGPSADNNLGRNLALGVGGLLVLLLVGAGGFMFGRRGRVTA